MWESREPAFYASLLEQRDRFVSTANRMRYLLQKLLEEIQGHYSEHLRKTLTPKLLVYALPAKNCQFHDVGTVTATVKFEKMLSYITASVPRHIMQGFAISCSETLQRMTIFGRRS